MRVTLDTNSREFTDVQHIEHRSDGTLVLRTSSEKIFVQPDDYDRYKVGREYQQ